MAFYALAQLHQLHEDYRQVIKLAGHEWLLLQTDNGPVLIDNRCPHAGAPLTRASLADQGLRCPLHGMVFDVHTGAERSGACRQRLGFLPLIYQGASLGIDIVDNG
jgi:3-phenylpropionate/trans-cinnamate dioxygenase ferredoxin subunit